jgi:hypothetical protein
MIAIALCILAFVACFLAGRRSLGQGLVVLLTFGYFYGILRANLLTTYSHFIFDAGMLGLYLACLGRALQPSERSRSQTVRLWVSLLLVWPSLLVMLPFQPPLVSLVGLRGNIFFIPLLLLGSTMKRKDLIELSMGLALLDLVAVAFGGAEYFLGVPRFFPPSPVTRIIYASADVEGGFFRIPAIFSSAHAFGGTMIDTIPFLVGLWTNSDTRLGRWLGLIGISTAMLGVLMSATRQNFIFGCAMVIFFVFTAKVKGKQRIAFLIVVGAVAVMALTNTRFQRFKSLGETSQVTDRIAGSVNRGFWEILVEYPMGNGLGGGGTSIPYFLEGDVRNPIGMENEYSRILSEQGVIGFLLWLSFILWFLSRARTAFEKGPWAASRRLTWTISAFGFGTAWIGTGILTSIPATLLLMVGMGWTAVPEAPQPALPERVPRPVRRLPRNYVPVAGH